MAVYGIPEIFNTDPDASLPVRSLAKRWCLRG